MNDDWNARVEAAKEKIKQREADAWLRVHARFSPDDCTFIRKHYQTDMSASQLAKYFECERGDIDLICKILKLKITANNMRMTAFCSPYPPQIAKSVKKFSWANYLEGDSPNGQNQAYSTDPN